ncbi:SWAHB protein, partial [Erythrocercus mccallii]|nr:SWAHB protein [Erythrocercus mccallii]
RGTAPSTEHRPARSMARELSQEAVLDFLWAAGGRAPNTALLRHFQRFLRDPALTEQQRRERREYFKSLVNSLATVHPAPAPGASKDIVLRRRYRDLLDEELPPPEEQREQEEEKNEPEPQPPAQPPRDLPPSRSLPLLSRPDLPPSRSLPVLSAPEVLPLSRSLQALPASPSSSPLLLSGPEVLAPTRLPPSHSRSLQQLSTEPSPDLPRGSRGMTPKGPTQPQVLRLYPCQSLTLPSAPEILPPARSPPPQPLPQSAALPSPSRSLQPPSHPHTLARSPPSQSLVPAQGPAVPQAPESQPSAPLPVFQSIRRQIALSEVQGTPPSPHDDRGWQPRSVLPKSSPRNAASRGPSVPLGQREHAWLVAMSAGRWAQLRPLFLEEPELALQRDFISGFTVLHWLAKQGDGPGLQELAAAARQRGLALDVDARSGCGYTPLHLAAIHGHQLVIKVLVLQLGCQVQVRDGSGRQPWEYLGSSTSGEIWQLLEAP